MIPEDSNGLVAVCKECLDTDAVPGKEIRRERTGREGRDVDVARECGYCGVTFRFGDVYAIINPYDTFCEMCKTPKPSEELTSVGGIIGACDDCTDEEGRVVAPDE